jgi:hypothetical protein
MVLVERRRHVTAERKEHAPMPVGALGPVQFSRCPCGFTLAKYDGKVFWIRAKPGICELLTADDLARALRTRCWHYRNKNKSSGKAPMPLASSNSHTIGSR